jgi:hypothetical protein
MKRSVVISTALVILLGLALTAASRVLSVTVWISPSIALPISQFDWGLRRMADGLEAMSVGI